MENKLVCYFLLVTILILSDHGALAKKRHRKKSTSTPNAANDKHACNAIDDCWLVFVHDLGSSNNECKSWRRYGRCLRAFASQCKDDMFYAMQLKSVRIRIAQLGCSSSKKRKTIKNKPKQHAVDNARPLDYQPADNLRHLRRHQTYKTQSCQVFGYGHLRTFSGDMMTCSNRHDIVEQQWSATLFEIDKLFSVRSHYHLDNGKNASMSQINYISITFTVNNSDVSFHLLPSNDSNRGVALLTIDGDVDGQVELSFGLSDKTFSVADVTIRRAGLQLRVRRRRSDSWLHSVTMTATTTFKQMAHRKLYSSSDLCLSGCSYDGNESGIKVDLASEISQWRFNKRKIWRARKSCSASVSGEYLSPCVFDYLVSSSKSARNTTVICKKDTAHCTRLAIQDLNSLMKTAETRGRPFHLINRRLLPVAARQSSSSSDMKSKLAATVLILLAHLFK